MYRTDTISRHTIFKCFHSRLNSVTQCDEMLTHCMLMLVAFFHWYYCHRWKCVARCPNHLTISLISTLNVEVSSTFLGDTFECRNIYLHLEWHKITSHPINMDKFTDWELQGLKEFFNCPEIVDLVIPVAKIVSKYLLNPQSNSGKYSSDSETM